MKQFFGTDAVEFQISKWHTHLITSLAAEGSPVCSVGSMSRQEDFPCAGHFAPIDPLCNLVAIKGVHTFMPRGITLWSNLSRI